MALKQPVKQFCLKVKWCYIFCFMISKIISPEVIKHILCIVCFIFAAPHSSRAEMFFWTDANGTRHYSNVTHSSSVEFVEVFEENNRKYNAISNFEKKSLKFRAVKIYDGDSMKVEGSDLVLMVRLVGIDAPESGRKGVKGQPFSREAKEMLTGMIGEKPFYLKSYGTGSYNRLLSEVFTEDGTNVNLEMLRNGMAEVYRGSPPGELDLAAYKEAESRAKLGKLGIWSTGRNYISPKKWRKEHPRK
ncbi:Nuclease (SNase domain-containing protein) (modular protein) [Desulfamplus magnetovallimortis]|uniref:Nuclease (SNase domain-containing protein) (Modular protein) n=1 Tax=Desulfamplus magnetovallimortis TaxID=1246637 RepID=A0A1W1HGA3_9BACT|nr:thermonuclease family protein [Desulfamplus magnetovallimortis]SLM31541.1 Nuclease (SNase domain-containing protein) (modular protein) [Desulfamplus magnetovallimortis]